MIDSDLMTAFRNGEVVFLTVAEMAEATRLSRMTIYRHIHSGTLDASRFGGCYRIPVESARRYLQNPARDTA